jgi:hypothetical protein
MRKIHYRNIGFPKTGTNWLWAQLGKHPSIDGKFDVYYKEYKANDIDSYKKIYEPYDITYNMDPHVFIEHDEGNYLRPERIHEHATHLTMIFRSPYEVLNSMYNMGRNKNLNYLIPRHEYIDIKNNMARMYSNITGMLKYWEACILPIKYMLYDDLKNDPKQFMHDICDHIGIKPFYDPNKGIIFPTEINDPLVFDNKETIDYINKEISVIENLMQRDLSHWKKQ